MHWCATLKRDIIKIYLRYNTPLSPIYWIGRKKRSKTLVKHRKKTHSIFKFTLQSLSCTCWQDDTLPWGSLEDWFFFCFVDMNINSLRSSVNCTLIIQFPSPIPCSRPLCLETKQSIQNHICLLWLYVVFIWVKVRIRGEDIISISSIV